MKTFGSVLGQARREKGYTLDFVASKVGSHKGYISGMISGKVNPPSPKVVRKLAKLLGVDLKELLILAAVEKVDREIRDLMREGSLGMLEASRKRGETRLEPVSKQPEAVAVG